MTLFRKVDSWVIVACHGLDFMDARHAPFNTASEYHEKRQKTIVVSINDYVYKHNPPS